MHITKREITSHWLCHFIPGCLGNKILVLCHLEATSTFTWHWLLAAGILPAKMLTPAALTCRLLLQIFCLFLAFMLHCCGIYVQWHLYNIQTFLYRSSRPIFIQTHARSYDKQNLRLIWLPPLTMFVTEADQCARRRLAARNRCRTRARLLAGALLHWSLAV